MELRRPQLADKTAVLDLMAEFQAEESPHAGGFWDSQRGKGYAKEMLTEALQVCQAKNIKRALLTCHSDNPASRAVILANGGLLGNILDGVERYWIEVGRDKDE